MVTLIHLYPIVAACIAFVTFDLARNLRRKGKTSWPIPGFISLLFVVTIILWCVNRGDRNAEQWAKDWASVTFSQYSRFV